ncbi:MAG: zinc finger domain-containing protein [Candidatus Thiodiazotropha sp. (ex Lucinoma aequizonata)]|nr:zinc finger domain-containing protein [Candidatus Thiodiazotropha sp. (ex Lucinoma aequizonata)]
MTYDGKSNWTAFKRKFERYAVASNWTEDECKDAICWSLTGKAADFYALVTERDATVSYFLLMDKMERRFGVRELAETSYARFQSALQKPEEELEDWADRVLTLANRAFKHLPENHMTRQAVIKFCQGCCDKEAGQAASNAKPRNIDVAMEKIRWFQFNSQTIYGIKGGRSKVRSYSSSPERDEIHPTVAATRSDRPNGGWNQPDSRRQPYGSKEERGRSQRFSPPPSGANDSNGERLTALEEGFIRMQTSLEKIATEVRNSASRRTPSTSPTRNKGCFYCFEEGHFKRECPHLRTEKSDRHVTFRDDLNRQGSGKGAEGRPETINRAQTE